MDNDQRISQIEERIKQSFAPTSLEIVDDSASHAGHTSAKGGGHFFVTIVSEAFHDKSLIQRHRMVYAAMGEMMQSEIHALSITAHTPNEQ